MESIVGKKIRFDQKTAPDTWVRDDQYNELFLKTMGRYFNDVLQFCGYISIETICSQIGVKITPEEIENTAVYRYANKKLVMNIAQADEQKAAFEITFKEE